MEDDDGLADLSLHRRKVESAQSAVAVTREANVVMAYQNANRCPYGEVLAACRMLEVIAPFGARVAGTPPLGLDVPGSDIDVLCYAPNAHVFAATISAAFGGIRGSG